MRRNNRFARGSGVYVCTCCKKKTRETGHSESFIDLCRACYEIAGDENMHVDGNCNLINCDYCAKKREVGICNHKL